MVMMAGAGMARTVWRMSVLNGTEKIQSPVGSGGHNAYGGHHRRRRGIQ